MKKLIATSSAVILMIGIVVVRSDSGQKKPMTHSEWVARSLDAIQTMKVGMTRRDILKLFTVQGGISNRIQRTYVFRDCPYIKIDVRFEPVGATQDRLRELPEDRIISISRPYLERQVID